MFELIIRGGTVIDGTGKPAFRASVGIRDDKIAAVGDLDTQQARRSLVADGLVVAPGFIDIHAHSDFTILVNPGAESKIRQGITTEVTGNCGISPGPMTEDHRQALFDFLSMTLGVSGAKVMTGERYSFGEYLHHLRQQPLGINLAPLVGHTTLRIAAMGMANRRATEEEMTVMEALLDRSLDEGAVGLSSGLEYPPASYSTTGELIRMGRIAARHGSLFALHVRSEDLALFDAIAEAARVGKQSGCQVEISHLKLGGVSNWGKAPQLLAYLDSVRSGGVNIGWDQYPYVAWGSSLIDYLPHCVAADGRDALEERLRDMATRQRIRAEIEQAVRRNDHPLCAAPWDTVRIALVESMANQPWEGHTIAQIAVEQNRDPLEVVFDLLADEKGAVKSLVFCMSEDDVRTIVQHPQTAIATDGRAVAPYGVLGRGSIHPRYYGTFPRVLGRYVREEGLLSLEDAIYKMTLLPAQRIGMANRGCIAPGKVADLVLFDPATIQDVATFEEPHQYAAGIRWVIVAGEVVIDHGEHTGNMCGKVLTCVR
jgi:N-acyl-D-amino-acid deacylase